MSKRNEDSRRKTCLITGGTSGIGKATLTELAKRGYDIIFTGTNSKRGAKLERALSKKYPGRTILFDCVDNSSISEIRDLAKRAAERFPNLDLLINNAGARNDRFAESPDGTELTFAANYLGHFLLTLLLAPQLIATKAARVVHVSSRLHRAADINGKWILSADNYDRKQAYAMSKLANILFSNRLASVLPPERVSSNCVDPGIVASRFEKNNGPIRWMKHLVSGVASRSIDSPKTAAHSVIYAATADVLSGVSGKYIKRSKISEASEHSRNPELIESLWNLSVDESGLTKDEQENWNQLVR